MLEQKWCPAVYRDQEIYYKLPAPIDATKSPFMHYDVVEDEFKNVEEQDVPDLLKQILERMS